MIFLTVICSFKSCRSQQLQSLPTISESEVNQYLTSQSEDLLTKLVASGGRVGCLHASNIILGAISSHSIL